MAFKGGAEHRTARSLNRAAERLGTDLEGATGHEHVEFSAVVRAESATATLALLTDIAGRALLEEEHLETERGVILQEIADDLEDAGTVADARMAAAMFPGHRLGIAAIGDVSHVERLTHAQLVAFRDRQWSPEAGVAVLAGNLDHLERSRTESLLLRLPARAAPAPPPPLVPFERRVVVEERDSDVVHLRLAYAVPGLDLRRSRDRAVADVYSVPLGGPAGSRLFEEIREERGLCYSIDGWVGGWRDASFLYVDATLAAAKLEEAYGRIDAIVTGLARSGPTEEEVSRARSYVAGTDALSFESTSSRADYAVHLTMDIGDDEVDPLVRLATVEAVTRGELAELGERVVPGPSVGAVGPVTPATFG
jgi:predicted Zn-dependent peptidase